MENGITEKLNIFPYFINLCHNIEKFLSSWDYSSKFFSNSTFMLSPIRNKKKG